MLTMYKMHHPKADIDRLYIVESHESTQPNMNSINKTAAKITEELSQPNEKSDAKQDGLQHTKARLGVPKEKMGKQSNAWAVH